MKIWVYLLTLNDDSLYVGVTTNMVRRLKDHQAGIGSIFTKGRVVMEWEILCSTDVDNKYQALLLENKQAEDLRKQFPFKKISGGTLSKKYKKIVIRKAFKK